MKFFEYGTAANQRHARNVEDASNEAFLKLAKEKGFSVRKANEKEDRSHVDYFLSKGETRLSVDVKGAKKFSDQGFLLVEIVNVAGQKGWLLGAADLIAFQTPSGFLFVPRQRLFALVKEKMGLSFLVKNRFQALVSKGLRTEDSLAICPAWRNRFDRPSEMVTYLRTEEIANLAVSI